MAKTMHLYAATNNSASKESCSLDVTKEKWEKLSQSEKDDLIGEYKANVLDMWVEEAEDD